MRVPACGHQLRPEVFYVQLVSVHSYLISLHKTLLLLRPGTERGDELLEHKMLLLRGYSCFQKFCARNWE